MTIPTPEDVAAAIDNISTLVGSLANNAAHIAHARRSLYDAYLAEGFNEAQALELCQRLFLS